MTRSLVFIVICCTANIYSVVGQCDPLIFREGVRVRCLGPDRNPIDCHKSRLPVGTVGTYSCETTFYIPANEDILEGKVTCTNRGRWNGAPQFNTFSCTVNCGRPLGGVTGLVIGGIETHRSEWPWHASIFARPDANKPFRYICGGTLVKPYSKGFVILTAAHCLATATHGSAPRDTKNVKIVLGADFSTLEENEGVTNAQIHNVREIVIHNSYEGKKSDFQADIAVVALEKNLKLNLNVVPACFSGSVELTEKGSIGHVVGFGRFNYDSDEVSLTLRQASLPVVDDRLCTEWRNRKLLPMEICAGFEKSQSVCNGDSGGGYLFEETVNRVKRHYIQGIVSNGRRDIDSRKETCDSFSVFTKVQSYTEWIRKTAERLFQENEEDEDAPELAEHPKAPIRVTTAAPTRATTPRRPSRRPITEMPTASRPEVNEYPESPSASQGYEVTGLNRHNYYRRMHGVPSLRLNAKLQKRAQAYADKLLRDGTFLNENEEGINKNVYHLKGGHVASDAAVTAAVDSWYKDIQNYDWAEPSATTFSQIVWKSTTDMGIGVASGGLRTVVVAAYSPPGNLMGANGDDRAFRENVLPKQTS